MKKVSFFLAFILISCSSSEESKSFAPDFGYHVDRIINVAEGQIEIGTFIAAVSDGSTVTYETSNNEMTISSEGLLSFISEPDFEIKNEYLTVITATNDSGSDQINVKVKVIDTLCELDTAAAFNACFFE